MRTIIWIIIILVIGFIGWKALMTKPPQDLPAAQVGQNNAENNGMESPTTPSTSPAASTLSGAVNREASSASFVGYGPGKEHPATFAWTENLTVTNGMLSGTATFDTATVKTDNAGLDKHLCTADFFNCAVNKQIVFTVTSATPTQVTGTLAFAGKTQTVSFPASISGNKLMADFRLDRTPFNFKYTIANVAAVDKEIRVQLSLVVQP